MKEVAQAIIKILTANSAKAAIREGNNDDAKYLWETPLREIFFV